MSIKLEFELASDFTPILNYSHMRKAFRVAANDVRKEARRLIARRAISGAMDYPGRNSGRMQRSIQTWVAPRGLYASIAPQKTSSMDAFYPAFLIYGVRQRSSQGNAETWAANRRRRRGHTSATLANSTWRIAPRRNFMADALTHRRAAVYKILADGLCDAMESGQ